MNIQFALILGIATIISPLSNQAFAETDERVYAGKALVAFNITNVAGEIDIQPSTDGKAHLSIHKKEFDGCSDMLVEFTMVKLEVEVEEKRGNTNRAYLREHFPRRSC